MQRCSNCGELNDDSYDYCAYCGEVMYIQVENNSTTNNVKMDHLYADSLAREFVDSNTNNIFDDDMDDITRELLGETKDESKIFIDDEEFFIDTGSDTEDNLKDEELTQLENKLKEKIRRNKKLEASMGLILRNIDVILDDYAGPLDIMGEITTNDKLGNKSVQLSAVSYDANKNQLTKNETIINVDHGNFNNFDISLDIDFVNTAIIIIVPKMIHYDNDEKTDEVEEKVVITNYEKYDYSQEANNIFIEQLTDIERKIGMTISNTAVLLKSDYDIEIVGEIRIKSPDKYRNIKIAATCYDELNHIIGTANTQINTKLFLGFDTLSLKINNIDVSSIQRIKLYPTLQ